MRRIACLLLLVALLGPAPAALAQESPFGPLPPSAPAATPTPENEGGSVLGDDVGRPTLYAIGGGFLVFFVAIGWFISRDARRTLPQQRRDAVDARRADPKERHRREREKTRARQKTRAQKAARKAHRRK